METKKPWTAVFFCLGSLLCYDCLMKKGVDYVGNAVVFLCHDGEGHFLFCKRSNNSRDEHGCWEIPGGGLKHGETIEEGMLRELKEELGVVAPISYSYVTHHELIVDVEQYLKHWIGFLFLVHVSRDQISITEPDMCDEMNWFTFDNLPAPLHSSVLPEIPLFKRYILEEYKDRL
ncbi:MAG: 8-oxo-dGTP pyrophosphatase MutT (NUDIX family) [Candidatus Azotimanducaceae bacterium]|jgi:8-oxo-dGTP pyrophosphatase MutT (NUDIX family)